MSYNFKKIADLELLNVKPDGASVVIEDEGAVKRLQADKIGVTSWNDLKDKPFGETTVKGDTITWDGNTEGCVEVIDGYGQSWYHVSDAIPHIDECQNGIVTTYSSGTSYSYTKEELQDQLDVFGLIISEDFVFIPEDNYVFLPGTEYEYTFPEAGVYLLSDSGVYPSSLTIPGYNGFETTTIQPIETKYLPEHLQFGTETKVVEGDTLTWDGNTDGLVSVDAFAEMIGTLYKISDAVPTLEDCIGGATYTVAYDGKQENQSVNYDAIAQTSGFAGCLCIELIVLVAPENNFQIEVEGVTAIFPEAGLYTAIGGDTILTSLTIPGYTGFVSKQTVIKPLAEQYMPILTSPSGKKFKLSVDDSGVLSATEV